MAFVAQPLNFKEDELAPHISENTVRYHYGKHTAKYFEVVNELTKGTKYASKPSIADLVSNDTMIAMDTKLFHNACQAWNHDFYFQSLTPARTSGTMSDELLTQIKRDFDSVDKFKAKFTETAIGHFGSGWAWLIWNGNKLVIKSTPNAGTPLTTVSHTPLLTCDLWEHSYLYDSNFVANRAGYVKAWWNVVNWKFVSDQYANVNEDTVS